MISKRHIFITIFLIMIFLPAIAFSEAVGKITRLEGRVDILKAGTTAAVQANAGDSLSIGDIVRTKSDGKAEITFVDSSVMTLGPKSRLGIDEYLFKPDEGKREVELKLYRGRTGFHVPKPVYPSAGSKFEMKTRTAVAGVRGTKGNLYNELAERVYVKDGIVVFYNPLGSVVVTPGHIAEIFHGQKPVLRPVNENEFKREETGGTSTSKPPPSPPPPAQTSLLPTVPATGVLLPLDQPVIPITDITTTPTTTTTTTPTTTPTTTDVNINVVFP